VSVGAPAAPRPIRALVADDEPLARRGVRQLLAAHADVEVVGESRDGRETLAAMATLAPDVVFLDVQMPGLDGLGVLRAAARAHAPPHGAPPHGAPALPAVVFLTAYEEFAVDAFEVAALDYLVKPVAEPRFAAAMARVRRHLAARAAAAPSAAAPAPDVADAAGEGGAGAFLVRTSRGQVRIEAAEVSWVGAEDYCVALHARGRRWLLRESMDALEARLAGAGFVRVHRSALVNVARVRELQRAGGETLVRMDDGARVPVSRRRRAALARALRASVGATAEGA
jgi:two-component system LytT family response regulator